MRPSAVTVGIPIRDLEEAVAWYSRVLEKDGPDLRPMEDLAEFDLGPSWLQLFVAADRAGVAAVTINISVPDAAAEHARLAGIGVEVTPLECYEGVVVFFQLVDPDGNRIGFVEEIAG